MDSQEIESLLVESGVLDPDGSGDHHTLSPVFLDELDESVGAIGDADEAALREEFPELAGLDADRDIVSYLAADHPRLLGLVRVLRASVDGLGQDAVIRTALALYESGDESIETEGSPAGFFPTHVRMLPLFLAYYRVAVLYVWREECPPCDAMKEGFAELLDEIPEDVLLVSVYGPEAPDYLDDRFGIVGGPTTLFVIDGRVDSRLQGAHPTAVIRQEIETTLEVAGIATS